MKKVGKAIGFIYLVLLVLIFVCVFVIIYGICNTRTTIFQNKYYNSIEELRFGRTISTIGQIVIGACGAVSCLVIYCTHSIKKAITNKNND